MSAGKTAQLREYLEALAISIGLAIFIMIFVAQSFLVQGESMLPTFHDGERLLVDKLSYRFREPRHGEVIVFRYPADRQKRFIKRIVGLPGDEILIRDFTVYVNGQPLEEASYTLGPTLRPFGPVVVPEGTYFVLGDNRNRSEDSRNPLVGFVPRDHIVGRALFVYWPITAAGFVRVPETFRDIR